MTTPDSSWTEPFSTAKPQYPYNNARQTRSGHLFELDDTPGAERVRLQHGTSNNFIEMQADGTGIFKVFGNNYQITMANNTVYIGGQCNITIVGPSVLHVQGDSYIQVDGNVYQNVSGDSITNTGGDAEIIASGDIDITSQGTLTLSGETVNINSDLNVNGSLSTMGSSFSVGSITTLGAIAAGVNALNPALIAGNIYDNLASLNELRETYNIHVHEVISLGAPTATPLPIDPLLPGT